MSSAAREQCENARAKLPDMAAALCWRQEVATCYATQPSKQFLGSSQRVTCTTNSTWVSTSKSEVGCTKQGWLQGTLGEGHNQVDARPDGPANSTHSLRWTQSLHLLESAGGLRCVPAQLVPEHPGSTHDSITATFGCHAGAHHACATYQRSLP